MFKQPLLLLALITLLILPAHQQICSLGSSGNDQLQSGSRTINNGRSNNPSNRQHVFNFNSNFNAPSSGLQIAASASNFFVTSNNGMDFAIWGSSVGNSVRIVLLINEDNSWSSVRVTYLISGRTDFHLGSYSAGVYNPGSSSQSVVHPYSVPGWTAQSTTFRVVLELAGVRTYASQLQVTLTAANFNSNTGLIATSMSLIASPPIESVVITYIIFSTNSPIQYTNFQFSQGSALPYQLSGMDTVQSGAAVYAGNGWSSTSQSGLTCIGGRCPSNFCVTSATCIASQGTISNTVCYMCLTGQQVSNNACVNIQTCGANMELSGGNCVCRNGYTMYNGQCYASCGPNAIVINNQCSCLPGYTYSVALSQCAQPNNCGNNYVFTGGQCVCPTGYGIHNNQCGPCPVNMFVNPSGNCQCLSGYAVNPNTATCELICFANAFRNSQGVCVCINGYYNQGNQCIPQGTCTGGLVWDSVNGCVCPAGQVKDFITNVCTYCNTLGRVVSGLQCICATTYYPTSTGCNPCIANSQYDANQGRCVCNVNYHSSNGQCIFSINCPLNAQYSQSQGKCVCNDPNQYILNGACAYCTVNSHYDSGSNICVCDTSYDRVNGVCTRVCVNGTQTSNGCVCWSGYYVIGGVCKQCDANSAYDSATFTCVCNDGYFGTWNQCSLCDGNCKTCSGPASNQCLTCDVGVTNNGICTNQCPVGFFVNSTNQCQACTANCILCYTATSCATCKNGYSTKSINTGGSVVTTCEPPTTGATHILTVRTSVLGNRKIYQGAALSLMPSSVLTTGCSICNDLLQIDVNSQFANIIVTQEYVTNSNYFFVIIFDFPSSSFVPNFEFTIRIKNVYASHFTSQDMSQVLRGAFSQASFDQQAKVNALVVDPIISTPTVAPGFRSTGGRPTGPIAQSGSTPASTPVKTPKSVLDLLFGN